MVDDSWDEQAYGRYQRERGMLEDEQERLWRADQRRIEESERLAYGFQQDMERMHYSFERVASRVEGVDAGEGHRGIDEASQEARQFLRRELEEAIQAQQDHKRGLKRRLDDLEQDYYHKQRGRG